MAMDPNLLKEAIADAKAVRATALANAQTALAEAFGPWDIKHQFEIEIRYPEELEKLLFNRNPWDSRPGHRKFTPMIYLRAAIEKFKKCMPAERKTIIVGKTYRYRLQEFSLTEKNKSSVNSWEDYSFIGKIKVVPHRDCVNLLGEVMGGEIGFFYKGDIDLDEDDQISDIILTDITLRPLTKPNP